MRRDRNIKIVRKENTLGERQKRQYSYKAEGESISYFFTHNIISIFLFFWMTIAFGIYGEKESSIAYILTLDFLNLVFIVFGISFLAGFLSRLVAYYTLKIWFKYYNQKTMKEFRDMNKGINNFGLIFFLTAMISSIVYSLGIVIILQQTIFNKSTFVGFLMIYIAIKLGIFALVRIVHRDKLYTLMIAIILVFFSILFFNILIT